MNVTVLIPSAGFASPDLFSHLKNHKDATFRMVLTDMNPEMPNRHYGDAFYSSPATKSENYLDFILDVCAKEKVDVIMPGKTADAVFLARNKELFRDKKIGVVVADYEIVKPAVDKAESYKKLKAAGIAIPESFEITTQAEFLKAAGALGYPEKPICIKPSRYPEGSGRGFRIIDASENVHRRMFWEQPSEMYYVNFEWVVESMQAEPDFPPQLVMEYLPYEEFSIYCFCNAGECEYVIPNRRISLYQMSSMEAVVEHNEEVEEMARRICALFQFDYHANIQIKYSSDRIPKVIEINPRVAGTIMLPVRAGVDLVYYGIMKALNKPYPKNAEVIYGTTIKREFKAEYYVAAQMEKVQPLS